MTSGVASIETHESAEAERPALLREVFGRVLRQERTRQGRTLAEVRGKHFGGDYMGVLWLDDDAARRVQAHLDALREALAAAPKPDEAAAAPAEPMSCTGSSTPVISRVLRLVGQSAMSMKRSIQRPGGALPR